MHARQAAPDSLHVYMQPFYDLDTCLAFIST